MLPGRKKKGRAPQPPLNVQLAPTSPAMEPSPKPALLQVKGQLSRTPTLTKESTVIKSGLVKVAFNWLGMNHWKLRNMELCWDPVASDNESTCKVQLRLTIFPAKHGQSHKRTNIPLSDPHALRIVSQDFVNRNVLLIQSDADYYISTQSKEVLVDWLATLKAALNKMQDGDHSLFFINVMPGQSLESCEALFSIVDNSLLLQKPVHDEMFYMASLSSIVAFGANQRRLTWWLDIINQRRSSMREMSVQHYTFSAVSVEEVITYVRTSVLAAGLEIEEISNVDSDLGEVQYKVLHPEVNDMARIEKQQQDLDDAMLNASPHIALAEAKLAEDGDSPDGQTSGMMRRITWSGLGREGEPSPAQPQEFIEKLRSKRSRQSQSTGDLSQTEQNRQPCASNDDIRKSPGGRLVNRRQPSLSPPSSPPPAPPSLILPDSPNSSQPTSPMKGAALAKARRPMKPPRHDHGSASKHLSKEGSNELARMSPPIYASPDEQEMTISEDGMGVVVSSSRRVSTKESLSSATLSPITDSHPSDLSSDMVDGEQADPSGTKPESAQKVPASEETTELAAASQTSAEQPAEGGIQSNDAATSGEQTARPVPKPRRRARAANVDAAISDADSRRQVSPDAQVAKSSPKINTQPRLEIACSDAEYQGASLEKLPDVRQQRSLNKPAVPIRSDSITDVTASSKAAADQAKQAAVLTKSTYTPLRQVQEDHIYEDMQMDNGRLESIPALPPSRATATVLTTPPVSPRTNNGHLSDGIANELDDFQSPVPPRGPPDGQEADDWHGESVSRPYEETEDDEPIYMNLSSCRLPTICASDDEL